MKLPYKPEPELRWSNQSFVPGYQYLESSKTPFFCPKVAKPPIGIYCWKSGHPLASSCTTPLAALYLAEVNRNQVGSVKNQYSHCALQPIGSSQILHPVCRGVLVSFFEVRQPELYAILQVQLYQHKRTSCGAKSQHPGKEAGNRTFSSAFLSSQDSCKPQIPIHGVKS